MTEELFRADAYTASTTATVTAVTPDGIVLDRTVFYPMGGGQPGDTGTLTRAADGAVVAVADTRYTDDGLVHVPDGDSGLAAGDGVTAAIDWPRRHRLMRMHTLMHVLCGLVPGAVTGGQVGTDKSRLDFDLPEAVDKEALNERLDTVIAEDRPVHVRWIDRADLADRPELVRTLSVQPPADEGRVRLVEVEGIDHQSCGGTHVASTGEIGAARVGKVEKKGQKNRRINLHLDDQGG